MPSNHLILCHPLLFLPSFFPSIRVFSNEPALHIGWPKYWSFSFNISPSSGYLGLISFRMDCLDLLAVQGTLKSHLQHPCSKASILWCSAFFIVQLSHPYRTTRNCSRFILLQVVDQFPQHHLLKRLSFLHCIFLASFVKDKVSIGAWIYLWAFYFVPLIYISVFAPVP